MKSIAAIVGVVLFVALTSIRAEKVGDDAAVAAYGDWSFCAICTIAKSEYSDRLRWYRFVPAKIYWGSHNGVRGKLLDSRLPSQKSEPLKTFQYIIMVRNPDGLAPGEAYFRQIPLFDEPMPAKWYGLKGDSEFTVEEIKQALEKMRDTMRKRFPIDAAPEKISTDKDK